MIDHRTGSPFKSSLSSKNHMRQKNSNCLTWLIGYASESTRTRRAHFGSPAQLKSILALHLPNSPKILMLAQLNLQSTNHNLTKSCITLKLANTKFETIEVKNSL